MIMYHDQMGSMPGKQSWFVIQQSMNEIHYINRIHIKQFMIISADTEEHLTNSNPLLDIKQINNYE